MGMARWSFGTRRHSFAHEMVFLIVANSSVRQPVEYTHDMFSVGVSVVVEREAASALIVGHFVDHTPAVVAEVFLVHGNAGFSRGRARLHRW